MPTQGQLSRLIAAAYDAASDASLWTPFLRELAVASGAHAADLMMHDVRQHSHTISSFFGVNPDAIQLYNNYFYQIDPWVPQGALKPEGWVGGSERLCEVERFRSGEFFNDYSLPYADVGHAMFAVMQKTDGRISNVSVFRSPTAEPFGSSELDILRALVPHLQRASRLHFQIAELKGLAASFQSAFDMISTAIMLLGAKGQIVAANRAAADLLSKNDGLVATRRGLQAECLSESASLQGLVADAVGTANGKGLKALGSLQISRRAGVPLQVQIMPIRNYPLDGVQPVCAMVVIIDPTQKVRPPHELLQTIYGMTPAECRVAMLLADGNSPKEIANMLAVGLSTVKTQLARIYGKTGTSRQSQAVRVLTQLSLVSTNLPAASSK